MTDKTLWSTEEIRARVNALKWFHDWEIVPGVRTNGMSPMDRSRYFQIPEDLRGKRVLDIGCADGFFTFLAESRGAEVVAIDSWPRQGFFVAHEVLNSKAEFHQASVYDLRPETFGLFDMVFFFGVYYHLRNPILALGRIAGITRGWVLVESEVVLPTPTPEAGPRLPWKPADSEAGQAQEDAISYFIERDEFGNDPTNWWVPNVSCLLQTVRAAGFPQAEVVDCYDGHRCVVRATKGPRTALKSLAEDIYIVVDQPMKGAEISGPVEIEGWALSQLHPADGIHHVWAYLDHLDDPEYELGEAQYGLWRPDQTCIFGDQYGAIGYRLHWDPSGVTPGPHTLHILADGVLGWNYRCIGIIVSYATAYELVRDRAGQAKPAGGTVVASAPGREVAPASLSCPEREPSLCTVADTTMAQADIAQRDYVVRSRVPLIGGLIAWLRRNLTSHLREPYLDPIIERQVAFNRSAAAWLKEAATALTVLAQRQAELEASVRAKEAQADAVACRRNRVEAAERRRS